MAASNDTICGVCDSQHILKLADHWCPECEEGLCSSCQNHHKVSRASRNHIVISIDDFNKLPSSVVEITHYCKEHDSRYQHYCSNHDMLCCPSCISSTHKECKELVPLREIKTSNMSSLLDNMEETLQSIRGNINKLIKNRSENLTLIGEQRKMYIDKVKEIRNRMITIFDSLEQKIIKDLDSGEATAKGKIEAALNSLTEKSQTVEALVKDISAVKQYASPLQAFIASKHLEAKIIKEQQYMNSLSDQTGLHQIQLKCTINDKIKDFLSSLSSLSSVSNMEAVTMETSPLSMKLQTEKEKHAQIMLASKPPSLVAIKDLKLNRTSTAYIPKGKHIAEFLGCSSFLDGKIIITDSINKRLIIMKEDKICKQISCPISGLHDVTVIADKTVAVSGDSGIHFVNIVTEHIEKEVKTEGQCQGILFDKGCFLCCVNGKGIQRIQLQNESITTLIRQDTWIGLSYITLYGDNIYQTFSDYNTVTCYNINGYKLWVFRDTSVLSGPRGVTIDNSGNVYIVAYDNHSIVVLSNDGKKTRQLLGLIDGLWCPWAINIDMKNEILLVINKCGPAILYTINKS